MRRGWEGRCPRQPIAAAPAAALPRAYPAVGPLSSASHLPPPLPPGRTETTRAAIISVESDYSLQGRTWQWRNAFHIYCVALFVCFTVTLGTHPGITSFICSTQNPAQVWGSVGLG